MYKSTIGIAIISAFGFIGTSAMAECNDDQQAQAAAIAANITKAPVSKVVPVTGKQMVSVDACDATNGNYIIEYKYNFLGDGGLYWVTATAKFGPGGASPSIKFTGKSPNLAAAEAKSGIKLGAN